MATTTTTTPAEDVIVRISRPAFREVIDSAIKLNDRRDYLLERNTDGELNDGERDELESLIGIAQVCMLLEMAAEFGNKP